MGVCLSKPAVQSATDGPAAGKQTSAAVSAGPGDSQKQLLPSSTTSNGRMGPPSALASAPSGAAAAAEEEEGEAVDAEYTGAPAPVCELNRIKYLHDLDILYTKPEQRFDDITRLCTLVFKVPIALVSLVDTPVQWFKSAQGLGGVDRTPRSTSFCAWTLLPINPEALVVEDASKDLRFKDNPLVTGAPHIRFYAGCPLVSSNGMRLGSLCIIDRTPRSFDANSCSLLANMAEMVLREIEKDKMMQEHRIKQQLQSEQRQLLRAFDCFNESIMLVEVDASTEEGWSVLYANEAWEHTVGRPRPHDGARISFWDMFQVPPTSRDSHEGSVAGKYTSAIKAQQNFDLLLLMQQQPGSSPPQPPVFMQAQFRCAANTSLDKNTLPIGIPNFLPNEAGGSRSFYFATLKEPQQSRVASKQQQQQQQHLQQLQRQGSAGCVEVSNGSKPRNKPAVSRCASFTLMSSNDPFPDIKLGPLLGKGAFGRVYRATWQGRMVAVKIIEYTQLPGQRDPLEGLLSEQVHHPNVVATYMHTTRASDMASSDYMDDDNSSINTSTHLDSGGTARTASGSYRTRRCKQLVETWLVLEFCNRGCISDAVEKGWFRQQAPAGGHQGDVDASTTSTTSSLAFAGSSSQPDLAAILATAREIAAALSYLHSKNILHGDLTGNNVLLTASPAEQRGYAAKVSDFGLSRLVSNDTPVIETRTYGTVTHMPPELLLEGHMSKAVDVYSWGVIVWEMYSGCRPFAGLTHSQVLHAVGMGRTLKLPPGMPAGLGSLLASCLAADPAQRPSIEEVLDTVTQLAAEGK